MKSSLRGWGLVGGIIGGAIWAALMFLLTIRSDDQLFEAMQRPAVGFLLSLAVSLLAIGFLALAYLPRSSPPTRIAALACAAVSALHAIVVFVTTVVGFKAAFYLAFLTEPGLTLTLALLAVFILASSHRLIIKAIAFLMVPTYTASYVLDPASMLPGFATLVPDLLAAGYGVLWVLLGASAWPSYRRMADGQHNPGIA